MGHREREPVTEWGGVVGWALCPVLRRQGNQENQTVMFGDTTLGRD